jgi:hypothetical protein
MAMTEERFRPTTNGGTQPPLTNAQRQARFKERRKAEKAAAATPELPALPAPSLPAPQVTAGAVAAQRGNATFSRSITLIAALAIATVQGGMAVTGLTTVFAGAFWPVIAMGSTMEFAKLAGVAWLSRDDGTRPLRTAMVALVAILMVLSSVGSFGFLTAAHLVKVTVSRAVVDQHAAEVEARAKVQDAILADIDRRISQIDTGIDEMIKRGRAAAAMALADQLKRTRAELVAKRDGESLKSAGIEIEVARIRSDREQLAADDGPVQYLAILLGASPDATMRIFILVVAILLDPLAAVLLLAAQAQGKSARRCTPIFEG